MDKCTYCAGGPDAHLTNAEYVKYGANRLAEGKLPLCAEMCSTKALPLRATEPSSPKSTRSA